MGVAASVYAAVTPLAIPILLIPLAYLLVRRVEKNGGAFEVDWKTVAFRIKYSSAPDGLNERAEAQDQSAQPEATAAAVPQPADGAVPPPRGGGGP
ncbi:hypothetical protein [Micromonospora ureilytica]|uniref:hypothetical protein n=1 Tax=Micromonospora ureilytica TaxID=709868 RepID=UPI000F5F6731|nr:hypothetical protein [Micromonospora ureilytica]